MIPNTTPTPNELYNGEMAKMGDTELRLVLVVTRATLGWEMDSKTGMRKQEDWLSHAQLKRKTGRSSVSIAKAIDICIKKGWIEARDKEGNILDTKSKRIGEKIYYRLGRIFLDKIEPGFKETKEVGQPGFKDSLIKETLPYKRNVYTKDNTCEDKSSQKIFSFKNYLQGMKNHKNLAIQIISLYWIKKNWQFETLGKAQKAIKRELKVANELKDYSLEDIQRTFDFLNKKFTDPQYHWTLETTLKYINDISKKPKVIRKYY